MFEFVEIPLAVLNFDFCVVEEVLRGGDGGELGFGGEELFEGVGLEGEDGEKVLLEHVLEDLSALFVGGGEEGEVEGVGCQAAEDEGEAFLEADVAFLH